VKLSFRREEGVKVVFSFDFVSHYPTLFLIGNQLFSPSRVCFACESDW